MAEECSAALRSADGVLHGRISGMNTQLDLVDFHDVASFCLLYQSLLEPPPLPREKPLPPPLSLSRPQSLPWESKDFEDSVPTVFEKSVLSISNLDWLQRLESWRSSGVFAGLGVVAAESAPVSASQAVSWTLCFSSEVCHGRSGTSPSGAKA